MTQSVPLVVTVSMTHINHEIMYQHSIMSPNNGHEDDVYPSSIQGLEETTGEQYVRPLDHQPKQLPINHSPD